MVRMGLLMVWFSGCESMVAAMGRCVKYDIPRVGRVLYRCLLDLLCRVSDRAEVVFGVGFVYGNM